MPQLLFSLALYLLGIGVMGLAAFFIYGLTLLLLVGTLRAALGLNLREGEFPAVSPQGARWALANALYLVVTISFIDFILLTPFAPFFWRLMGAKVGRAVQINSKYCADLSLLEVGDQAVIGGHATVIGHSFERGRLILKRVRIGPRAVVGLNAVLLPGAEIGEGATVAAGAIVPKDTRVPPHSTYYGP